MLRQYVRLLPPFPSRPHRTLASIPIPKPDTSPPSPPPTTSPPHSPVDLFEDDIFNAMFSPHLPTPSTRPSTHPNPPPDDIYLYPPAEKAAYRRQLDFEQNVMAIAVDRFRKLMRDASTRGDVVTHRPAADLLAAWFGPLALGIQRFQKKVNVTREVASADGGGGEEVKRGKRGKAGAGGKAMSTRGPEGGREASEVEVAKLLRQLPTEALSVITIHCALSTLIRDVDGVALPTLAFLIANTINAEVNYKKLAELRRRQEGMKKRGGWAGEGGRMKGIGGKKGHAQAVLNRAMANSNSMVSAVNYAAQQAVVKDAEWDERVKLLVGTTLIDLLVNVAKVQVDGDFIPAFRHFLKVGKKGRKRGVMQLTDPALKTLGQDGEFLADTASPKQQPMVVRPRPWYSPNDSPYLKCKAELVRMTPTKSTAAAIGNADLSVLYKGLNALGDTAWKVNEDVLNVAERLWENGGGTAGLVTKVDVDVPERDSFIMEQIRLFEENKFLGKLREGLDEGSCEDDYEFDERKAKSKLRQERRKAQKVNRELVSLRADTAHKLENARRFANEEKLWLPHNVDFRGRAYPIPVYLQHMGCDMTRSLLSFAKPGVELGERGVFWLKVHLANKLGADKLPLQERVDCAEANMGMAIAAGKDPMTEKSMEWWSAADDPFQLLAACFELARAAGRHGGEKAMEGFKSCLPISMDGSCNGLQHYAAMGRDSIGAKQVNLTPSDRPQDVYNGVAKLVNERIDEMVRTGDEIGILLQGKVSRKVIKQTVMTSVYGVTIIGAREQIGNRLSEIDGFPEDKIFEASLKLASLTLSSLGVLVSGATKTMEWLSRAATAIAREGHEVEWVSPVGLPVVQPYRKGSKYVVKTLMQRVTLDRTGEHSPISGARQRSAFAPNFVHSVDSSHMLMTAIGCEKRGLNFAAVHDSFWTNAACVDVMHEVLREEFIKLHRRDLLGELREGFLIRYPHIELDELPEKGELDVEVVKDSTYFFS